MIKEGRTQPLLEKRVILHHRTMMQLPFCFLNLMDFMEKDRGVPVLYPDAEQRPVYGVRALLARQRFFATPYMPVHVQVQSSVYTKYLYLIFTFVYSLLVNGHPAEA
jgi:hypothetical protein